MSLRNRLLWLEEMHELVLRWSRKRPMMHPDGTVIGPEPPSFREDEATQPNSGGTLPPRENGNGTASGISGVPGTV
jgi:hypothetical protein